MRHTLPDGFIALLTWYADMTNCPLACSRNGLDLKRERTLLKGLPIDMAGEEALAIGKTLGKLCR